METIYLFVKIIHIAAGSIALLAGLAAILLRKKVNYHRKAGKIYFWCMSVIFFSALLMASYHFNLFLLCIAVFTYHAAFTARRSLKLKQLHLGQRAATLDWLVEGLNSAANLGLILFGFTIAAQAPQMAIVAGVFGCIGLRNSYLCVKRLRGLVKSKNYWLTAHIAGMLASYIGAITAFTVNNNRWMGLPPLVAWLGPTLLLVPFIIYEVSRVTHKNTAAV